MTGAPAADTAATNEPLVCADRSANGVVTLTLNRPRQFNALSRALMAEFQHVLDTIADDPAVRVVVIAGSGRAFCAGHDLKEMRQSPERPFIAETFAECARLMTTLTRIPQPVIARVHGIATAAGCQLVASCDLAVAADDARFAVSGVNLGLFCATPMVALTRNVPRKAAMEMLMTGDFIDAPTARAYGLVNRVVPPDGLDDAVDALARAIVAKSPAAVAFGKRLFYTQLENGLEAAYDMAAETMTCNMMTEDAALGIDAFIDKRPMPPWTGR
jgi:enoyl-CoA hydratase/carnithine racemase